MSFSLIKLLRLKYVLTGWPLLLATGAVAQARLDYGAWELEQAEEFNQPTDTVDLGARWRFAYPWGRTINTLEAQYYTANEVRADSAGVLRLTAHTAPAPIRYRGKSLRYTAGMLMSRHVNDSLIPTNCPAHAEGFSYGLFEIRCQQPRDPNAFPAFWLYGGVPDEIDIFEASPYHFGNTFHQGVNHDWRPSRPQRAWCSCFFYENQDPAGNLHQQYHTYSLSWLPNEAILYFDGVPIRHETRLLPTGCAMWLIINLAIWDWSAAKADAFVIDYIRVYRPRQPPRPPAGQRLGAEIPTSELAWLPAERPPGHLDSGSFQRWQLAPAPDKQAALQLELTENYNPACDLTLPLPVAGHWAPAWVLTAETPLQVHVLETDSLRWTIHDFMGRECGRGAVTGGAVWRPHWPKLPPGAYSLHLAQGGRQRAQPLRVAARPVGSAPTPEWQTSQSPATRPPMP